MAGGWPGPQAQGGTSGWKNSLDFKFQRDQVLGNDWLWVKLGPSQGLKSPAGDCTAREVGGGDTSWELWGGVGGGIEHKAGPEGQLQRTGVLSHSGRCSHSWGEAPFLTKSWIHSLFLGLSFLPSEVSTVSIDFGKYAMRFHSSHIELKKAE